MTRPIIDADAIALSKKNMKKFVYKDKVFNSIKQAYEYFGLTRAGFYYRRLHNIPLDDEDLDVKSIIYNNKKYKSLTELYNDNKDYSQISYSCFVKRVRGGMTIKEALSSCKLSYTPCRDSKGNIFKSVKDAASFYNVHYKTILARLSDGLPLDSFRKYKNKWRISNAAK